MERIRQKTGRIKEHLTIIRSIKDDCRNRFAVDPVYRGALLHYLYLLSDSCIVLAELVIKHRALRIPQSYAESFDILGDNHILDAEFAYNFAKIASFRNFLAHDYEKVNAEIICGQILNSLDDVDQYLMQISAALELST
ncbi:MAG: type VII toxin-antitoxin system HepT family RNase toxin [Desulfuromonadaceae bacterium]